MVTNPIAPHGSSTPSSDPNRAASETPDRSTAHNRAGLIPQHRQLIQRSAVSPTVASQRGYRSVEHPADLAKLGFADYQHRVPALLLPIWDVYGRRTLYQLRPDHPRHGKAGKPIKYETPPGSRLVIDVPPSVRHNLGNPSVPLIITEGVRKADAAVSAGACSIDLLGVWGWRGTNPNGGKTALPDWEVIALNGRTVIIAFDSDVMAKDSVRVALERLSQWLTMRNARVWYCVLPDLPDGSKQGLDDWFANGGTL